jgi:Xaa-Pro aminopeptidase
VHSRQTGTIFPRFTESITLIDGCFVICVGWPVDEESISVQQPEPPRGFPEIEFQNRTVAAQKAMAAAGLDGLLFTTEPEIRYFTGFLTQFWQSPTRPWFLIIPQTGKPVAVIPAIGAACMARTWIHDIRCWSSPQPDDEGVSLLADTLEGLCGAQARLGVQMGPETYLRMPLHDFSRLQHHLPAVNWSDASDLMRQLRMVKSPAEIDKIAYVAGIISDVFDNLPHFVHPRMSQIEAFRAFKIAALTAGVDDIPYLVGASGQGGYGDIISPPSHKLIIPGDVLIMDTGAVFDGYYCDFDRNFAFGHADDAVQRAYAVVFAATEAGFEAAKIGARVSDIFTAMWGVLEAGGALGNDVGRLGHGLGMQLTEPPSNTGDDHTVIAENMVLTLEPGMTFSPGKVMVHEENIVITKTGARYLSRRAAAALPIIA